MEKKNFLSEEDVRHLPNDQQIQYKLFLDKIRDHGTFDKLYFNKFEDILEEQYRTGALHDALTGNRFPEILAANINAIVNQIIEFRNNKIEDGVLFDVYKFKDIYQGIEKLEQLVKFRSDHNVYEGMFGAGLFEDNLPRIQQLKNQVAQDISFYQGYSEEKTNAIDNYLQKKEAYDKLSLFGKFAAIVNGQKKALQEAKKQNDYYDSGEYDSNNHHPGGIVNPFQYDEYLEKQQLEQSTGGRRR